VSSEARPTPGPWDYRPEERSIWAEGGFIAGSVRKGNARLIAAAPELLEACKALVEDFDTMPDSDDEYVSAVARITEAVEKAEGR